MVTRIIYDTEFIDNGTEIIPISIAMVRPADGAQLYAINNDLSVMARAAERDWMRENVLRWLPLEIDTSVIYDHLDVHVAWDLNHPEFEAVKPLDEIRDMVEDFVLAKPDPQLWAYYASYDHVLYAQLFGPMIELPQGMPMYTMDLKHECVMHGDPRMPKLPNSTVNERFNGVPKEHHALYDAYEEAYRLDWLEVNKRTGVV